MTPAPHQNISIDPATLELIDRIALEFETAWRDGSPPQIEKYLEGFQDEEQGELFRELLAIELEYRRRLGEEPDGTLYEAEFPQFTAIVQAVIRHDLQRHADPAEKSRAAIRQALHSTPRSLAADDTGDGLANLSRQGDDLAAEDMPARVGEYEILGRLGRGGMGVVYKARQISLNRIVALKMILSGSHASKEEIQRFRSEAESAAQLQHSHIVPIYEIGEHRGHHYFSMGFVDGRSLDELIEDNPLSSRQAATYVKAIAEAVHYAHQQGVLHRDLKPSNVLVDHQDEPHVADFGLAKLTTSDAELTLTGQVLGTPNYIAPEQALGHSKQVQATSDVYSIGAMLYALVTGRPPFNADTTAATIMQLVETDPVPPALINPSVDQDLETITLKCLEKSPQNRYTSAEELALELGRYLRGEPIHARPIGVIGRLRRWCSRNRAVAALLVAIMLALASGTGVSGYFALQARAQAEAAKIQAQEATAARKTADEKAADAERNAERERLANYFQSVALAERELSAMHAVRADELLEACPSHLREWEWHYLKRRRFGKARVLAGEMSSVAKCVAFSPDGRYVVGAGPGKQVGQLVIWDLQNQQQFRELEAPGAEITGAAFTVDGGRIVGSCIDNTVRVWDVDSGKVIHEIQHEVIDWPMGVAVSPDGEQIAIAGGMSKICLTIDAESYEPLHTFPGHAHQAHDVAFSPDSRLLSSASIWNSTVRLWDAKTGEHLRDLKSDCAMMLRSAISPQGELVATTGWKTIEGDEGELKVWNATTGALVHTLTGHSATVESAAFSPDGKRMASTGIDKTVILWDAATGREILSMRGHEAEVFDVEFSPDGTKVISSDSAGRVILWDATPIDESVSPELVTDFVGHQGKVTSAAFSPDGRQVASGAGQGTVMLWDAATGETIVEFQMDSAWSTQGTNKSDSQITSIFFDPSGEWILGHDLREVFYRNIKTGQLKTARGRRGMIFSLAMTAEGKHLASGHWNSWMSIWNIQSGSGEMTIEESFFVEKVGGNQVYCIGFSPDLQRIVLGSHDGTIKIRKSTDGSEIAKLAGHKGPVRGIAYHVDNQRVISGGEDGLLRIWDAESGEQLALLADHNDVVRDIALSPDGRWIASAGKDRTIKIWNSDSGQVVRTLIGHTETVYDVSFDPTGRRLVSAAGDGTVKVWDLSNICVAESETE